VARTKFHPHSRGFWIDRPISSPFFYTSTAGWSGRGVLLSSLNFSTGRAFIFTGHSRKLTPKTNGSGADCVMGCARSRHHSCGGLAFRVVCRPTKRRGTLTIDVLFDPGARFRNGLLGTLSVTDIVPVPIHTLVRLIPLDLGTCARLGFQISAFHFEAPVAFGRRGASASNRFDALLISALRKK
jgi:hypothetical protein